MWFLAVNVDACAAWCCRLTEGYSGSDLTALAKDAALGPIRGKHLSLLVKGESDRRCALMLCLVVLSVCMQKIEVLFFSFFLHQISSPWDVAHVICYTHIHTHTHTHTHTEKRKEKKKVILGYSTLCVCVCVSRKRRLGVVSVRVCALPWICHHDSHTFGACCTDSFSSRCHLGEASTQGLHTVQVQQSNSVELLTNVH